MTENAVFESMSSCAGSIGVLALGFKFRIFFKFLAIGLVANIGVVALILILILIQILQ